jgi:hypothetical protein
MEIFLRNPFGWGKTAVISFLAFFFLLVAPFIANAVGLDQATQIAKISESNPYQALTFVLALVCVGCCSALAYVYNQNLSQVKEQYLILDKLSDNISTQTNVIARNQEILEKTLNNVDNKLGNKPCLLDSPLLIDIIKNTRK